MNRAIEAELEVLFEAEAIEACFAEGAIDRYLAGDRSLVVTTRMRRHLPECARCRAILEAAGEPPSETMRSRGGVGASAGARSQLRPGNRRSSLWVLGVLAASIAFVARTPAHDPAASDSRSYLMKGGEPRSTARSGDLILTGIERGELVFRAADGDRLHEGDLVTIFYSSREPGHLAVWNVDASGAVTRLWPDVAGHDAITFGEEVALGAGAVVGPGSACEWLVGVFTDQPIDLAATQAILEVGLRSDPPTCRLQVSVPSARTVSVRAFIR